VEIKLGGAAMITDYVLFGTLFLLVAGSVFALFVTIR
jgi:hypothetical protein